MEYQKLFDHMLTEHGLTLLQSEMQEIIEVVREIDGDDWIKIESEKDLPKQDVDVHLMLSLFNGKHGLFYTIGVWDNELKAFFSGQSKLTKVTHYQPIQEPTPPKN